MGQGKTILQVPPSHNSHIQDDYCGRLNLLTPTRVKAAAAEIRTGETAPLDLPSNVPATPGFGRQDFKHTIKALRPGKAYDDLYDMNTQSGTQWDGFRHVAHQSTGIFYNNTSASDFTEGNEQNTQCSIHHWRDNGFSGRGVLLDYKAYADHSGIKYDTGTSHEISYDDLVATGKHQGLDIRPTSQGGDIQIGDILLIRSGWTVDYYSRTAEQNKALGERSEQNWAGVKPSVEMVDWLHDCYFSAVGGDVPAFERYPFTQSSESGALNLHEYLLSLWGVPIGEMLDLEKVSELAKKNNRYTFFVSSAPFRTVGGVASWVNGTAIF